ncbi:MAG: Xaa-Pro peptidase family protein [Candidatus Omnitrophica bacterium]|nr:Xaa-Pro peptidase family protein [Candidatus Omnitrophota bacterium]
MKKQSQNLFDAFQSHQIDAFLVTKDENIFYLTGYRGAESWLLVTGNGMFYLTDGRHSLEAKSFLKKAEVVQCRKSIFDELAELALTQRVKALGFDEQCLTVSSFKNIQKAFKRKIKFVGTNALIEKIRAVKRKDELAKIKKALWFHKQCLGYLGTIIRPGRSEKQIFQLLDRHVGVHHYEFSFQPIIASGPNTCYPHARITDRKIRRGDPVLVDIGIDHEGYKSDLTRMFFLGKIPHHIRKVYDAVGEAQRLAIAKIKPGVLAKDIDSEARNFLKEKRLDVYFTHSLGHGVGLEIHETPGVSPKNSTPLKEGMVLTVEPGVYIPGQFGIRIEDMVLVTAKGHKLLSKF